MNNSQALTRINNGDFETAADYLISFCNPLPNDKQRINTSNVEAIQALSSQILETFQAYMKFFETSNDEVKQIASYLYQKLLDANKNPIEVLQKYEGQLYLDEAVMAAVAPYLGTVYGNTSITYTPPTADKAASISFKNGETMVEIGGVISDYNSIDLITDLNSNPCANDVFEWLNNSSTTASYIINQFADGQVFEKYNYHISIANLNGANGTTSPSPIKSNGNSNIYTALDCSYLKKATKLSILRTMIHESLHAWMVSVLNLKGQSAFAQSFPIAFNEILKGKNLADAQHEQFIRDFVATIASALRDYDGNVQSYSYYEDLAMSGLSNTDYWNTKLTQSDRDRITNITLNEQEGNAQSKGQKCTNTGNACN